MEKTIMERRKNYYIKKEFQRNFIIKFCILVIIGSLISGIIIYTMSRGTVTTIFENSRLAIKSTADYILPAVFLSSVIVVIVIGIATIFVTLFTSHKIAGPLYRMEKDVQGVGSGNLKMRFNLRQGDELKPIATSLDTMTRNLRNYVEAIKTSAADLEKTINNSPTEIPKEVKNKLENLKNNLEKINT